MKPVLIKKAGLKLAFPDVCHIPAPPPPAGPGGIPIPFPNTQTCAADDKVTKKVKFNKKGVVVENSKDGRSMGDEAGVSNLPTPKGLQSQKNMGKIKYKTKSSKVKAENKGVCRLLDSAGQNGGGADNAPMGKAIAPCQVKILSN